MCFWDTIKYFKPSEFDSPDMPGSGRLMNSSFIRKLDRAREIAKIPFNINSGYRTKSHNTKVGGSKNSSHLIHLAADIHIDGNTERSIVVNALVQAGLGRRIGLGNTFVHVDDDYDKPQSWWFYPPKEVKTKTSSWMNIFAKKKSEPVRLPPFTEAIQFIKSGSNTDWSHDFYDIKKLHDAGYKGKGVKVAVLDTGVDLSHNSFARAIAQGRLTAVDARRSKNDPSDGNGHGTWCVSRYISDGNDVLGFAPECTVTSYKVLNDDGSGSLEDVMRGVRMAIDDGHHIISTSLGWSGDVPNFIRLVNESKEKGILWLSASGNDATKGGIDYPAIYGDIISVGSHDKNRKKSRFTDYGIDLDLYGSGQKVLGAYTKDREAYLDGTSMATPSVGALIATMYFELKKKYGKIDRHTLRKIAKCTRR